MGAGSRVPGTWHLGPRLGTGSMPKAGYQALRTEPATWAGSPTAGRRAFGCWPGPNKRRALPSHFITYSEDTIKGEASSRNLGHGRALGASGGS